MNSFLSDELKFDYTEIIADTMKSFLDEYNRNTVEFMREVIEQINAQHSEMLKEAISSIVIAKPSIDFLAEYITDIRKIVSEISNPFPYDDIIVSDELAESYNSTLEMIEDVGFNELLKANGYKLTPIKVKEKLTAEAKRFIVEIVVVLFVGIAGAVPGYIEMVEPDDSKTVYNITNNYYQQTETPSGSYNSDDFNSETLNNDLNSLSVGALGDDERVDGIAETVEPVDDKNNEN